MKTNALSQLQKTSISIGLIFVVIVVLFSIETKGISSRPDVELFNNVQLIPLSSS